MDYVMVIKAHDLVMSPMNYRKGSYYFTIFLWHWVLFSQEIVNQYLGVGRKIGFCNFVGLDSHAVEPL